jgi:hypothetical protein
VFVCVCVWLFGLAWVGDMLIARVVVSTYSVAQVYSRGG